MKNEKYGVVNTWYHDFDLNVICFSLISVLFALGSWFIDNSLGGKNWFVYFFWTFGITVFLYKFFMTIIPNYLDKMDNENIKKEQLCDIVIYKDWSELTMFSLGLMSFLWTSSWLYAFYNFSGWMWLPTSVMIALCLLSLMFIYSSMIKR